ncbi:MAG TPA: hypothetical protein VJM50_01810 [Pyrinomonadaceae bacterium]|nr:hypothetical protein [Pyrinomonadaceae bacterium]
MKKSFYVDAPPPRRPLKIFAFDPMLGRSASKRISIDIANELDLEVGPRGSRVEVIDFDGTKRLLLRARRSERPVRADAGRPRSERV